MKKLIVGMMMFCAAVVAQAAYVDWQYQMTDNKTGGTDYSSGYTAYLITSAAWNEINSEFTQSDLASKALDSSVFYQTSASKSKYNYSTGLGSTGPRQVEAESGNFYVILANSSGYNVALSDIAVTAYDDPTGMGTGLTPGITIGTPANGSGLAFTAYPTGSGGGEGVPEPTSGLLLLVGAGMLALRRKQK